MKLGLMAMFRNESHIIEEFMDHYIDQGVDHFYFIDNSSTDDTVSKLTKYSKFVTLKSQPIVRNVDNPFEYGIQIETYKMFLGEFKTEWLYCCDLDEFAYAKNGYSNLKDFIMREGEKFDQLLIPLKNFTSNKLKKQPDSVVKGFTRRTNCELVPYNRSKPLVRVSKLVQIGINQCQLSDGVTVDGCIGNHDESFSAQKAWASGHPATEKFRKYTEQMYKDSFVISNHYEIQSEEYFFNIKAKRGVTAVCYARPGETIEQWWRRRWNKLEILTDKFLLDDTELKEMKYGTANN